MVPGKPHANRYREMEIRTANPLQLVVMLYDGAIQSLHEAGEKLRQGDIGGRARAANRALAIISELQASLNFAEGGQISAALESLYGYMKRQIFVAGVENIADPLSEVISLLATLRSGWQGLAAQAQQPADDSSLQPAPGVELLKTGTDAPAKPSSLNLSY